MGGSSSLLVQSGIMVLREMNQHISVAKWPLTVGPLSEVTNKELRTETQTNKRANILNLNLILITYNEKCSVNWFIAVNSGMSDSEHRNKRRRLDEQTVSDTRFKHVYASTKQGLWAVKLHLDPTNGKTLLKKFLFGNRYPTPEAAARTADRALIAVYGPKAAESNLNFPLEEYAMEVQRFGPELTEYLRMLSLPELTSAGCFTHVGIQVDAEEDDEEDADIECMNCGVCRACREPWSTQLCAAFLAQPRAKREKRSQRPKESVCWVEKPRKLGNVSDKHKQKLKQEQKELLESFRQSELMKKHQTSASGSQEERVAAALCPVDVLKPFPYRSLIQRAEVCLEAGAELVLVSEEDDRFVGPLDARDQCSVCKRFHGHTLTSCPLMQAAYAVMEDVQDSSQKPKKLPELPCALDIPRRMEAPWIHSLRPATVELMVAAQQVASAAIVDLNSPQLSGKFSPRALLALGLLNEEYLKVL